MLKIDVWLITPKQQTLLSKQQLCNLSLQKKTVKVLWLLTPAEPFAAVMTWRATSLLGAMLPLFKSDTLAPQNIYADLNNP